jgi:hypothetical protein
MKGFINISLIIIMTSFGGWGRPSHSSKLFVTGVHLTLMALGKLIFYKFFLKTDSRRHDLRFYSGVGNLFWMGRGRVAHGPVEFPTALRVAIIQ